VQASEGGIYSHVVCQSLHGKATLISQIEVQLKLQAGVIPLSSDHVLLFEPI
jgi:hypothetical protein